MDAVTGLWARWVGLVGRPVDSRPLVLVKRLVAAVLVVDLLAIVVFGVADGVLFTAEHGGLVRAPQEWAISDARYAGVAWWALSLVTLAAVAGGLGGRGVLLLAVIAYAQLGHFDWPGDRGIDRICRTLLLLCVFSEVGRRRPPAEVAAWPADLLRVLLVVVYLDAGIAKVESRLSWLATDFNPLYGIVASPQVGRVDPDVFAPFQLLFAVGGAATLLLELSAPILLWRRAAPWWGLFGAFLHLGLAVTMNLGIFPYAMLALYPVVFEPWLWPRHNDEPAPSGTSTTLRVAPR